MDRRTLIAAGAAAAASTILRSAPARWIPRRPVPTAAQLRWQREETALFIHFGVNTFTDREWGDGTESPSLFDPTALDARQWARAARAAGAGSLVLTAKHHDGFCLWPTRTTRHSVASSPWRSGAGDVMREFTDACRAEKLGAGVYLSPWDRNAPSYGEGARYDDLYIEQLTELLTQYGPLVEVWFDGANGEGPNGKRQRYDWPRIHRTVRTLQPEAVIFSDAGPDVRWIGNERGVAGETCWSTIDPAAVPYAGYDGPGVAEVLQTGHPHGSVWRPGETDVSIRPGWFWHPAEDAKVRAVENLVELHFTSVGRNSKLLLNVPPTRDGLFHDRDVRALEGFDDKRRALFDRDVLAGGRIRTTSGPTSTSLEIDLPAPATFDTLRLEEAIEQGQHIANHRVDVWREDRWATVAWGTTIGNARLHNCAPTTASRLRVVVEFAYDAPALRRVAAYQSAKA